MKKLVSLITAFSLILIISACAPSKKNTFDFDASAPQNEKTLYMLAKNAMDTGRFEMAINFFHALESRFPFSRYSQQSHLDLAYAYYKFNKREEAISQADRFIRLNPTHEHVDYAYYIKGLANFPEDKQFLAKWFPRSAADLDQGPINEAFKEFSYLVRKYPNSRYAGDAQQRLIFLRNQLAEHDIRVAEFYMNKKAYVAAVNRAKFVLQNFPESPSNIEALVIMIKGYRKLGIPDLAKNAERILKLNAPNHPLVASTQ